MILKYHRKNDGIIYSVSHSSVKSKTQIATGKTCVLICKISLWEWKLEQIHLHTRSNFFSIRIFSNSPSRSLKIYIYKYNGQRTRLRFVYSSLTYHILSCSFA